MLDELSSKLTPAEPGVRAEAFDAARAWIALAARKGGVDALVKKTFQSRELRGGDIRVDIEISKGKAFVKDVPDDQQEARHE